MIHMENVNECIRIFVLRSNIEVSSLGGEALVACGMMEALLKVINWYGEGQEHITVSAISCTNADVSPLWE